MEMSSMREKQASRYAIEVFLSCLGAIGILDTLISSASTMISIVNMCVYACFFCAVFVAYMDIPKISGVVKKVTGGVFLFLSIAWSQVVYHGIVFIINDSLDAMEQGSGMKLMRLPMASYSQASKVLDETAAALFITVLISFLACMTVVKWRSMVAAVISILPLFILFVSFSVIPSTMSIVICILYVFGVMAIGMEEDGLRPALFIIAAGGLITCVLLLCIPQKGFTRMSIFVNSGKSLQTVVSSVTGGSANFGVAGSAINAGVLGKIDSIKYENQDIMNVTTVDTGKSQYIEKFIGTYYDNNRWGASADKNSPTPLVVNLMDSNKCLQDYMDDNTGKYFSIIKKYKQIIQYTNGNPGASQDCYSADVTSYAKFKSIADETVKFDSLYAPSNYPQSGFAMKVQTLFGIQEKEMRMSANQNDTKVPDSVKEMLSGLVGNITVNTEEQKEAYIRYVKDYLAANYTYTSEPGKVPDGEDFVKYFLMDSKKGYCTYFATAATMMLRCAGIPARYVEGYVITEPQILSGQKTTEQCERCTIGGKSITSSSDAYTVTVNDTAAHAWVEVYMDGYGWVPVEVTPGTATGSLTGKDGSSDGAADIQKESQPDSDTTGADQSTAETATGDETAGQDIQSSTEAADSVSNDGASKQGIITGILKMGISNWYLVVISLFVIFLAMVITVVVSRYYRLHRQLLQLFKIEDVMGKQAAEKILEMYVYLEKLLARTGYGRPDNISDEVYAEYLCSIGTVFTEHDIKTVINIVMGVGFGQVEKTETKSYDKVRMEIIGIRKSVLAQTKWWKRLLLQYIYVL